MKDGKIEQLSDFSSVNGGIINFDATVLSIIHEGKKEEKKPIIVKMMLENSGEQFNIASWNFDILEGFKKMSHNLDVANFEGTTSIYKDQLQIRVGKIKEVYLTPSTRKKMTASSGIKGKVLQVIDDNITDPLCLSLLDILIKNNEKFFTWPAARGIHHNFAGGLAVHSLSVAKLALAHCEIYGTEFFDKDILLTSALLHDIGKIKEYTEDCEISFEGNFTTHLVSGIEMIDMATQSWAKTEKTKKLITIVKHVIQSHHFKLEYGSPIGPKMMEAIIVAMCDLCDARYESAASAYSNLLEGEFSDPIKGIEGNKVYKWKKQEQL